MRGKLPDGRHAIETVFAFCTDGDGLSAEPADELALQVVGPFAGELGDARDNLVLRAAVALAEASGARKGAAITLDKKLAGRIRDRGRLGRCRLRRCAC